MVANNSNEAFHGRIGLLPLVRSIPEENITLFLAPWTEKCGAIGAGVCRKNGTIVRSD